MRAFQAARFALRLSRYQVLSFRGVPSATRRSQTSAARVSRASMSTPGDGPSSADARLNHSCAIAHVPSEKADATVSTVRGSRVRAGLLARPRTRKSAFASASKWRNTSKCNRNDTAPPIHSKRLDDKPGVASAPHVWMAKLL